MRPAARKSDDARHESADRLRRDRAAAPQLRVTFPAVQQIRFELDFESDVNTPGGQAHVLFPSARAFFEFPCPYADCTGQFNLRGAVDAALADSSHRAVGLLPCPGSRARDHAVMQPCNLRLSYRVTATTADPPERS